MSTLQVGTISEKVTDAGVAVDGVTLKDGGATFTSDVTIGDASASDKKILFDGNAQDFHIGLDDSADSLTIGLGSALGTTSHMVIDSTGHITKPLQSAFMANLSGSMTNLAINQTTVISFDFERFDQNADFAGYTFTAPVTGRYQLSYQLTMNNLDTGTTYYQALLTTSNKAYYNIIGTNGFDADQSYFTLTASHLVDMDANDTAYVGMNMPNSGVAQLNITDQSYFSGYLVA